MLQPMPATRVLIPRDRIAHRVAELGAQLTADLLQAQRTGTDGRIVLVPVLTGAMLFVADLVRAMPVKLSIRPVTLSSYPGTATSSQGVTIQGGVPTDLAGAHVVVVDDILDSGQTLALLNRLMLAQRPASVRIAVLLRKDASTGRRVEHVEVDYVGFDIPDEFVIGYGLDYDGFYRNLPDVCVLEPS